MTFANKQVAAMWAADKGAVASNGKGTIYCTGDTIYSYGSHFPIARWATYHGKRVVLLTERSYSRTTGAHIGLVRRSIPSSVDVIQADDVMMPLVD